MKFTQFGTITVVALCICIVFNVSFLLKMNFSITTPFLITMGTNLFLIIIGLLFYKLTISIDNQSVAFRFGVGLFGKRYKISDIQTCKVVKNKFWYGFGIRRLSNGWLYNVSGLWAIELTFKNQKGIVRIGTDKPEEVANFINQNLELSYKESGI